MKARKRISGFILLVILACLIVFGCLKTGAAKKEGKEEETAADRIQAFAYNSTENLLLAINLKDYSQFTKNFSDELKNAVSEKRFNAFAERILAKHGTYSRNTSKQNLNEVITNADGTVTFSIGAWFVKEGQTDTKEVPFKITYKEVDGKPKVESMQLEETSLAP